MATCPKRSASKTIPLHPTLQILIPPTPLWLGGFSLSLALLPQLPFLIISILAMGRRCFIDSKWRFVHTSKKRARTYLIMNRRNYLWGFAETFRDVSMKPYVKFRRFIYSDFYERTIAVSMMNRTMIARSKEICFGLLYDCLAAMMDAKGVLALIIPSQN